MGKNTPALSNFNVGEISPDMGARVDIQKYAAGCSTLSRFIPRVQGPARRTPGTRYCALAKIGPALVRRFVFSQETAYVIEFGAGYCRFYTNHAQIQAVDFDAWSSVTSYVQGSLVASGGVNYYCIAANTDEAPPNATYWYPMPSGAFEIPSPYTQDLLFNLDGTPAIQIEQSADVLYIACAGYWPMMLTRYPTTITTWTLTAYAPTDGPFLDENSASSPALYVEAIAGAPGQYICYSTAPVFSPSDVAANGIPGRLVRIDAQTINVAQWAESATAGNGKFRRYNGNTYLSLNGNESGATPPTQTYGVQWDGGSGSCQWLYQDSGYGIGEVIAYTNSTEVTIQASNYGAAGTSPNENQQYLFSSWMQGATGSITGITNANPCVVTVSGPTYAVGDPVYITGVVGMTQINNQMYTVTATGSGTITLGQLDSSGYSAYTSGGTAIQNASLNWALGAWGSPGAQTPGGYPNALCLWEDRLWWGGGVDGIGWWGSVPGAYSSHAEDFYGQVTADCAVSGIIAAQDVDQITWMSPAILLLIGTSGGEFALGPLSANEAIGPGNTDVERQSKWRSRAVRPEMINTSNYYVQKSGKKVLAQDYTFYLNRYDSTNQNRMANHIMGYTVPLGCIDIAYHAEPYETLWGLRSDGLLVGYTLDRVDDVTGWHEQPLAATLGGAASVCSMCVIPAPDDSRDELWLCVARVIGGVTVYSIEYMEKDYETGDAQADACYLDMSAEFTGGGSTLSLPWLVGESVQVLQDGYYGGSYVVPADGTVTLDNAYTSTAQAGLATSCTLTTMDIEGGADVGTAQGKIKRPNSVVVRVKNMLGAKIAVAQGSTTPATAPVDMLQINPATQLLGEAPALFSGDVDRLGLVSDSIPNCKLTITNELPFPTEILGIFPAITVAEPSPP